jgi:hypothetical protein
MGAATKQVQYIGPHDAVEVAREERFGGDGTVTLAIRGGDPITVPADHADSLLEQPTNWRTPKAAAPKDKE